MTKGHEPAFGFVDNRSSSYEDNEVHYGLTKREYFSANAPAIPEWFVYVEPNVPIAPKNWNEIKWSDEQTAKTVRSWQSDPVFDLDEEIKWFQDAWEKYWEDYRQYCKKQSINRYFAWRTFYADSLINELNKTT